MSGLFVIILVKRVVTPSRNVTHFTPTGNTTVKTQKYKKRMPQLQQNATQNYNSQAPEKWAPKKKQVNTCRHLYKRVAEKEA